MIYERECGWAFENYGNRDLIIIINGVDYLFLGAEKFLFHEDLPKSFHLRFRYANEKRKRVFSEKYNLRVKRIDAKVE